MKNNWLLAGTAAVLLSVTASVQALPTLTLSDNNGNSVSLSDASGFVSYNGALGNWNINVSTGIGYPFPGYGTVENPILDLNSVNNFAGGLGNILTITWTIDNVGPLAGTLLNHVGGTQTASITSVFSALVNGGTVASQSFNSAGSFSGDASGNAFGGVGSTVTLKAILTAQGAGVVSFDHYASVPDGGMTVILLGAALSSLGLIRRKLA